MKNEELVLEKLNEEIEWVKNLRERYCQFSDGIHMDKDEENKFENMYRIENYLKELDMDNTLLNALNYCNKNSKSIIEYILDLLSNKKQEISKSSVTAMVKILSKKYEDSLKESKNDFEKYNRLINKINANEDLELIAMRKIDDNHQDLLWNNGFSCILKYKNVKFCICVNNHTFCQLSKNRTIIESNQSEFLKKYNEYIPNDEMLKKLLNNHKKSLPNEDYLQVEGNCNISVVNAIIGDKFFMKSIQLKGSRYVYKCIEDFIDSKIDDVLHSLIMKEELDNLLYSLRQPEEDAVRKKFLIATFKYLRNGLPDNEWTIINLLSEAKKSGKEFFDYIVDNCIDCMNVLNKSIDECLNDSFIGDIFNELIDVDYPLLDRKMVFNMLFRNPPVKNFDIREFNYNNWRVSLSKEDFGFKLPVRYNDYVAKTELEFKNNVIKNYKNIVSELRAEIINTWLDEVNPSELCFEYHLKFRGSVISKGYSSVDIDEYEELEDEIKQDRFLKDEAIKSAKVNKLDLNRCGKIMQMCVEGVLANDSSMYNVTAEDLRSEELNFKEIQRFLNEVKWFNFPDVLEVNEPQLLNIDSSEVKDEDILIRCYPSLWDYFEFVNLNKPVVIYQNLPFVARVCNLETNEYFMRKYPTFEDALTDTVNDFNSDEKYRVIEDYLFEKF